LIFFILFIGRALHRIQFVMFIAIAALILFIFFQSQIMLQFQHSSNAQDLASRFALLQTAWRVIQAYPLTGIGLGHVAYLLRTAPYRVPMDYIPLDHPHNSYVEWAAMAGLPVLFVFLALLTSRMWEAINNWIKADVQTRSLLGGGLALIVALSFNSWSNDCWTLPPLAAIGWLILGAISSPVLRESLVRSTKQ
jgi:O-antigen ligase